MARFCVLSFGCRASQADGAAIKRQLLEAGHQAKDSVEASELVVIQTCTVTATADAEARQVIRRVQRSQPNCKILVTGCYAQRAPEEVAKLPGVTWVVGHSHRHRISEIVRNEFPQAARHSPCECGALSAARPTLQGLAVSASPATLQQTPRPQRDKNQAQIWAGEIGGEFHFSPVFADDRTRPTLKVQDGCNARCSFCVIPHVRGRSRSLETELAISQVRALAAQGYREVVLSGINLGSYGRDRMPKINFLSLLERMLQETPIERVRISSIEPMDVSRELIELVAREPRVAQHFHVPLQSGCNRILRLMNRRYWTQQYAEKIMAIRERLPEAAIGADVMAGFPGETHEDHKESTRFIESLPFTYLHVFPYSARPGTLAPKLPNPVDGRRAHERCREIQAIGRAKQHDFAHAHVGRTLSVLTLHETRQGERLGLSSNYLKVVLTDRAVPANVILQVRIEGVEEGFLRGRIEAGHPPMATTTAPQVHARLG